MRIAWFIHRYFPVVGGSENFARAMVRRFVARGDDVDVYTSDAHDLAYFTNPKLGRIDAPALSEEDGAKVYRLAVRHFPGQRYFGKLLSFTPHWPTRCKIGSYLPIIPSLGKITAKYDFAIGVAFPYTNFSEAARQVAIRSGGKFGVIPFLHLGSKGYTLSHQIELLKRADLVMPVTEFEAAAMVELGLDRSKFLLMPMALETEKVTGGVRDFLRRKLGIGADEPVIGQVGALDFNKGTEHLVNSVARLQTERSRTHLILAGRSTPSFEHFLATRQDPWLHNLGAFDDDLLPQIYAAIDVYAMPSRTDSFGIVFLEAWANGKPVVAAASGGVNDVVRHGVDGFLVPFGDVDQLTSSLRELIENKSLAYQFGQAGKQKVASGFTWDDRFRDLSAWVDQNCRRSIT